MLKSKGIDLSIVSCIPFKFEGEKRNKTAERIAEKIKDFDNINIINNEELRMTHGIDKPYEAYRLSNYKLIKLTLNL